MIKVNLLKSRIGDTSQMAPTQMGGAGGGPSGAPAGGGAGSGGGFSGGDNVARETFIKVLVMFLFVGGLMIYETMNLNRLKAELNSINTTNGQLDEKITALNKDVEAIKDIEKQARELEDKLKILKLLSRLRLREVKTLDFIQTAIPEKVWLKALNYEADKDKAEMGHFDFVGGAMATEDLTEFVKRLEDSPYLYEVIVIKNQELTSGSSNKNVTRDFNFTAQVEVKP